MSNRRQRVQEGSSVVFLGNSAVQHHDDAAIRLPANESPKTLAKFDDGKGYGVIEECTPPSLINLLRARLKHRLRWHSKRQFGEYNTLERFSGNVHAFPEAVCGEQYAGGIGPKSFEQHAARGMALL